MKITTFCVLCVLIQSVYGNIDKLKNIPEDGRLNFTELGTKYGSFVEEYDVTTEDGYILKMFHIPGNKSRPVLLMHGILDSADTFIIRGNNSLAKALCGDYDVWVGNHRGNRYSRYHTTLDESDKKFWDYSLDEVGNYDIPAMIDFILDKTCQTQLSAVAHSEGTTYFYVMGASRPEYNKKVKIMIALAPICYLHNIEPPLSLLVKSAPVINAAVLALGKEELFSNYSTTNEFIKVLCTQGAISYLLCADGLFFAIAGYDPEELEEEFLPVIIGHYPSGTSRKNALHLSQISQGKKFSRFDYGVTENLRIYGSLIPTDYNLSLVTMNIALIAGENDGISKIKDVDILRDQLPNVIEYRVIDRKEMNHINFVWGRNMNIYLFPHIFRLLHKYN